MVAIALFTIAVFILDACCIRTVESWYGFEPAQPAKNTAANKETMIFIAVSFSKKLQGSVRIERNYLILLYIKKAFCQAMQLFFQAVLPL